MLLSDLVVSLHVSDSFQENTWILNLSDSNDCVVIDPGDEPHEIIALMQSKHLTPQAILITHGHWDHIAGISGLREKWPDLPIYIGEEDRYKLTDPRGNLSGEFGFGMTAPDASRTLCDGEEFTLAGIRFKAIHVPGHSKGHVFYLILTDEDKMKTTAFVGDIIFAGSVGRADFADGNMDQLIRGIREKILTLPDQTILCPGHGPKTSVDVERRVNPWLNHRN